MKTLKVKLTTVSFIFVLVLGFSTQSFSCLCRRPRAVDLLKANDTLSYSDDKTVIIKGKVISNKIGSQLYNDMNNSLFPVANLKVLEFWPKDGLKLERSDTITIFEGDTYCSISFIEDSTFFVVAKRTNRYYYSHFCEGIKWIPKGETPDELLELGPGTKPILKASNKVRTNNKPKEELKISHFLNEKYIIWSLLILSISINLFQSIRRKKNPNE